MTPDKATYSFKKTGKKLRRFDALTGKQKFVDEIALVEDPDGIVEVETIARHVGSMLAPL